MSPKTMKSRRVRGKVGRKGGVISSKSDKVKSIQSEDAFNQSMDDLVAKFTDELKVRYGSEGKIP